MADGKWVMHDEDAKRVDLSFKGSAELNMNKLPNYGKKEYTDNRSGDSLCSLRLGRSAGGFRRMR